MDSIFDCPLYVEGSLKELVVGGVAIGVEFALSLPDVRGSHLSCIENFRVLQNGEDVPGDLIQFCLNGKEFSPVEFSHLAYEYWRIDENAIVRLFTGIELARTREIEVSFGMRVPYTGNWGECAVPEFRQVIIPE